MMNIRKSVRDILIIVIMVIVAIFVFRSRAPGPIESVSGGTTDTSMPAGHQAGMASMHTGQIFALSEGDPILSLGENVVGRTWFDSNASKESAALVEKGQSESDADVFGPLLALEKAFRELIVLQSGSEMGLEPAPEEISQRERDFYSSFKTEAEADDFVKNMGLSLELLEDKWKLDLTEKKLKEKIAADAGFDPESDNASVAYEKWMIDKILTGNWNFIDPDVEALFADYKILVNEALASQNSASETENSVIETPAGETPTEETPAEETNQ